MKPIGALRHRLELVQAVRADDGAGGFTRTDAAQAVIWADIRPASMREIDAAGRLEMRISHVVTIRAMPALSSPQAYGTTAAALYAGQTQTWDFANRLRVNAAASLPLATATEAAVLGGANAIAVENGSGAWEILLFVRAVDLGGGVIELSQLLRGRANTANAMADPVPAGARWTIPTVRFDEWGAGEAATIAPFFTPLQGMKVRWTGPGGRAREGYVEAVGDPDERGRFLELMVREGGAT